ncbi:hypothetical protein HK104_005320 [Borealophlyctis nickersoniae]|nr:hypothetical protein HK104_005320 [Borealophlyctis nickersoniae]
MPFRAPSPSYSRTRLPIQFTTPFIQGGFLPTTRTTHFINPADSTNLATVTHATPTDVDAAVKAAWAAGRTGGGEWGSWAASRRRDALLHLADLMEKDTDVLAQLETAGGKPIREARGDVEACVEIFRYFAGHADNLHGRTFAGDPSFRAYTLREPIGVCALITSFNYPLLLASWKMAPALACGNTVVIKPPPQAPLSTLYLAHLVSSLSIPPGVVNVLPGDAETGAALVSHPLVDKISFTGSTLIGRAVAAQAAQAVEGPKPCTLELGGKAPMIVCDDAGLDQAVEDIIGAAFVFYNVDDAAEIAKEEIFGPVLAVLKPFKTIDEAITRANASRYGLAAGIWTKDARTIEKAVTAVRAGMVWVNTYNFTPPYLPLGGVKSSGYGKDQGFEAIDEYTSVKAVLSAV